MFIDFCSGGDTVVKHKRIVNFDINNNNNITKYTVDIVLLLFSSDHASIKTNRYENPRETYILHI